MAATGWNISKLKYQTKAGLLHFVPTFLCLCTVCIPEEGSPTQHLFKGSELFSKVFIVLNNSENIKNGQFFYFVTTCQVHALMMKRENNEWKYVQMNEKISSFITPDNGRPFCSSMFFGPTAQATTTIVVVPQNMGEPLVGLPLSYT